MWEYLIGYGPAQSNAAWVVEARDWPERKTMLAELDAEGWELHAEHPHRDDMLRLIFRRRVNQPDELPRHRLPCW